MSWDDIIRLIRLNTVEDLQFVWLQGGSIIRLFHKELEAFLVSEGLFDDEISEDGLLRHLLTLLALLLGFCYKSQQLQTDPRDALHHAGRVEHKPGHCDKQATVVGRLLATFGNGRYAVAKFSIGRVECFFSLEVCSTVFDNLVILFTVLLIIITITVYRGYVSVHLRVREVDQLIPKSLYPSSSGNTYWQVETESSLLNGQLPQLSDTL